MIEEPIPDYKKFSVVSLRKFKFLPTLKKIKKILYFVLN